MRENNMKSAEDIVAMLDSLVSNGVGRINVVTSNSENGECIEVHTANSTEMSCAKGACGQPTEELDD